MFTSELNDEGEVPDYKKAHSTISSTEQQKEGVGRSEAEEEDELLYGDFDELTSREKLVVQKLFSITHIILEYILFIVLCEACGQYFILYLHYVYSYVHEW